MAPRARNTIMLRGDFREEHAIAGEAITPGMLVQMNGTGNYATGSGQWVANNSGLPASVIAFARENHEDDGHGIDDVIASGDAFTVVYPAQGAVVYALITGTAEPGDELESAGDGTLQLAGSGVVIAVAAGDSEGSPERCRVIVGVAGGFQT